MKKNFFLIQSSWKFVEKKKIPKKLKFFENFFIFSFKKSTNFLLKNKTFLVQKGWNFVELKNYFLV